MVATCITAIGAAALAVPAGVLALMKPTGRTKFEHACASLSLFLTAVTGILIALHSSIEELTSSYIAGGVLGIAGVLTTVNDVSQVSWAGTILSHGWTKWRGPTFLIAGMLLELVSTIAWLHLPPG
jgi:uncharacterized membrane protein HdeD (DUF308 family)